MLIVETKLMLCLLITAGSETLNFHMIYMDIVYLNQIAYLHKTIEKLS